MSTVLITGSAGLVGSEAARHFHALGWRVVGVDNDMRGRFFGPEASTARMADDLSRTLKDYRHESIDIRDEERVTALVRSISSELTLVIHTAAQPSHDWAARDPLTDFSVNATGTLLLLEAVRRHAPDSVFIFTSSNKVYGERPNRLPLVELETRYELPEGHEWWQGIPESMSIDQTLHSLLGASKASADLIVQEYGRYFGLKTITLRGGCLTGPGHAGAELHGFLAYLMKCTVTGRPYRVFGYKGKQVRDNIHSSDLAAAFEHIAHSPRSASVYNIGGGRDVNCSVLEAIQLCEQIADRELDLGVRRREPDRRSHVVDQRPDCVPRRLPRVVAALRLTRHSPGDLRTQRGTPARRGKPCPIVARRVCVRCLLLTPFVPYPPIDGGRVRILGLLDGLAGRCQIDVLALAREEGDRDALVALRERGHAVEAVFEKEPSAGTIARAIASGSSLYLAKYGSRAFPSTLGARLESEKYDVVQCNTHTPANSASLPGRPTHRGFSTHTTSSIR